MGFLSAFQFHMVICIFKKFTLRGQQCVYIAECLEDVILRIDSSIYMTQQ